MLVIFNLLMGIICELKFIIITYVYKRQAVESTTPRDFIHTLVVLRGNPQRQG